MNRMICNKIVKSLMTLLVLLSLAGSVSAAPSEDWNRSFGEADEKSVVISILQTTDGGYIVAGSIEFGRLPSATSKGWVFKIDANGNLQWNRTFTSNSSRGRLYDGIGYASQASDGGYILAGTTLQYRDNGYSDMDIWLIKTDATGNEQWNRNFGDNNHEGFSFVRETADGYIIAGVRSEKILLVKTDKNGNEIWSKVFDGSDIYLPIFFGQAPDGGFVLIAREYYLTYGKGHVRLIITDPNGNMQLNRVITIKENGVIGVHAAQKVKDGYILLGSTENYTENLTRNDIWLTKWDEKGNVQWKRNIGEGGAVSSVQATGDGGYFIAGVKYPVNRDVWITKSWFIETDENGYVKWDRTFGDREFGKVVQTSDGNYILIAFESIKSDNINNYHYPETRSRLIKISEKAFLASGISLLNNTESPVSIPEEKTSGFEAVLSITIILTLYIAGMIRR